MKKILVFLGYSNAKSYTGALADAYEKGAREAGFLVERVNIGDLKFDPVLHKGYSIIQELEPDLKDTQEKIKNSDHLVLIYPNWWGTMPAVLKGFFDRVWLPGFAFRFYKNGMGWEKLLKGKTAHVILTMDARPFLSWFLFGDNRNEICDAILGFSGFSVGCTKVGPLKNSSEKMRAYWLRKMYEWGRKGK